MDEECPRSFYLKSSTMCAILDDNTLHSSTSNYFHSRAISQRLYHTENTGSRLTSEVKQHWMLSVLGRVNTWEVCMPLTPLRLRHVSIAVKALDCSLIVSLNPRAALSSTKPSLNGYPGKLQGAECDATSPQPVLLAK